MGLFTRYMAQDESPNRLPTDDFWYTNISPATASGEAVNPRTAIRVSAFYAGVKVLSGTIASLPLMVYERLPNGGKRQARSHPLWAILHDRPNPFQTSFEWRELTVFHLCLYGNAYSEITPGRRGFVDQLQPLHPTQVTVEKLPSGRLRYKVKDDLGQDQAEPGIDRPAGQRGERILTQDEVLHHRLMSSSGMVGMSPVNLMRETLGLAMAVEKYGARFFGQGARPAGAVRLGQGVELSEPAQERLKRDLETKYGGVNAHKIPIFRDGMEWVNIGLPNEQSQFLETRKLSIEEIARALGIPAVLLQHSDKAATYASSEQFFLSFKQNTVLPWTKRLEATYDADLILAPQKYFTEFNLDGLLRADFKARWEGYQYARQNGVMNADEIRGKENMNPIGGPEGTAYLVNGNMMPAGQAGRQTQEGTK